MRKFLAFAVALTTMLSPIAAFAQEKLWVNASSLNRRTCPSVSCPTVGKYYFREAVLVFERQGAWVRASKYYEDTGCYFSSRADYVKQGRTACLPEDGYRADGSFAEWIHGDYLSSTRPELPPQPEYPAELMDPRIEGIPMVGELELSEYDVLILRRYAAKLLKSGQCSKIETGDKSVHRPGYYYVYCSGENRNRFFRPSDVE
jgi:hypothetical protein